MEKVVMKFWTEDDGNATVDWAVLLTGLVLLSAALIASVTPNTQALANEAMTVIEDMIQTTGV